MVLVPLPPTLKNSFLNYVTNLLGQIVADVQTGGAHVDVVIGAVAYVVGDDFVVATMNSRQMLGRIPW